MPCKLLSSKVGRLGAGVEGPGEPPSRTWSWRGGACQHQGPGAALLLTFSSLPFHLLSVEASFHCPPLSSEASVNLCLSRDISSNPRLGPPHRMSPHQQSPPHSPTVTVVSHLLSALVGASPASLVPVGDSPSLPGPIIGCKLPSLGGLLQAINTDQAISDQPKAHPKMTDPLAEHPPI